MSMKHYIGIDCGLDGGIVTLDSAGNIIYQRVMPVVKIGKGRKIDLAALDSFFAATVERMKWEQSFNDVNPYREKPTVCIEQPGGHAPSAAGLRSMTYSFAVCEALCVAHGLRYHEVTAQKWQREFWSKPASMKGKKFDTKAQAYVECCKLWPENDWTATERSKKFHTGLTDAALICEYGRRKLK
jgi:hypothetical protein